MLRTLPPAGHPLRLREIISVIQRNEENGNFLEELFPDIPNYLVSSGSAALTLSLLSIKSNLERTEVILPAYTCPSLVASVIKAGLKPVLCDLKPYSFQLDLEMVSSKIGPKTLAVMAVHLFGLPENLIELSALTRSHGVYLIEDAAQAFGNKLGDGDLELPGLGKEVKKDVGNIPFFNSDLGNNLSRKKYLNSIREFILNLSFDEVLKVNQKLDWPTITTLEVSYKSAFINYGRWILRKQFKYSKLRGSSGSIYDQGSFIRQWNLYSRFFKDAVMN